MVRSVLVGLALLAAVAPGTEAQQAENRRGLWLGLGAGPGSGKATCSVCGDNRETGLAAQVRAGGTVSRNALASVEGTGWLKNGALADRSFLMVSAVATAYPVADLGLHAKVGLGGYWYVEEDSLTKLTTQGLALLLGAGYDVLIAPRVSLSPFATLVRSGFSNPTRVDKASGFTLPLFSDMSVSFFQFGLGVTLH